MDNKDEEYVNSADLIIVGEDLDPAEITRILGLSPDDAWKKGEQRSYKLPNGPIRELDGVYENGGWKKHETPKMEKEEFLGVKLIYWKFILEALKNELREIIEMGYEIELNCFVCTSSSIALMIEPSILKGFGDLGIKLDVTFSSFCEKCHADSSDGDK